MRVEIWADVICPWCYLGHARFERALGAFEHREQVEVGYRSFELDPGRAAADVEPVERMLAAKFGPQAAAMEQHVAELARAEGLPYRTDREVGGTLEVHRLLQWARERDRQHEFLTAAFDTNFAKGSGLFSPAGLLAVAETAGLDRGEAGAVLADPAAYTEAVRADERAARELGVTGVPFVLLNGRLAVPGAQSADIYRQALAQAWAG